MTPSPLPSPSGLPDRDEALEASLGRLLDARIEVRAVLPLVACLTELVLFLRHARLTTWRSDQRRSLAGDIDAAVVVPGTRLRAELGTLLDDVNRLAQQLLQIRRRAEFAEHPDLNRLSIDAELLQERLTEPVSIQACWRDLISGVRDGLPEHVMEDRVRLLFAILEAAHHDIDNTRRHLHWIIVDGGIPWSQRGEERPLPSTSWRLSECESFLRQVAPSGRCIGWVALDGTHLPQFVVEAGSLTFFDAPWAVPNAELGNGQNFLHREELHEIATGAIPASIPREPNVVLARVDLGHRPVAGALDEAWRRAMFVAGYATLSARTEPWPKRGWHCLAVDGALSFGWFAPDDQFRERNPFQIERIGFELSRIADALENRGNWSSPELIEAVDCAIEARGAEVRNRNLLRWRVLEMVAAYIGLGEVDDLLMLLKGQWARDALGSRPVQSVVWTILGSPEAEPARSLNLALLKHQPEGRIRVLVRDALSLRAELLKVSRTAMQRRALNEHLDVLSDPTKTLNRLADLDREENLLFTRMRRVRNALTHGDPVTVEAISSVDNYVMYMTEFALQETIRSPTRKPLVDTLTNIGAERTKIVIRLQAGDDPVDVLGLGQSD